MRRIRQKRLQKRRLAGVGRRGVLYHRRDNAHVMSRARREAAGDDPGETKESVELGRFEVGLLGTEQGGVEDERGQWDRGMGKGESPQFGADETEIHERLPTLWNGGGGLGLPATACLGLRVGIWGSWRHIICVTQTVHCHFRSETFCPRDDYGSIPDGFFERGLLGML
jgi:hypothetical protein